MGDTLEKCEMRQLLSEKTNDNKKKYLAILEVMENPVEDLLAYTKKNFPNYTDHTIQHSYRILRYIYSILDDKMKESLSAAEIFCLMAATMLHDVGMSDSVQTDTEVIRRDHASLSGEYVYKFFEELKIVTNARRLSHCISYVCASHTKNLQELYEERELKMKDTINGEVVRYGYLTILLRIGDLLDMEEERTSYMVWTMFPEYYEKDGSYKGHHQRCEELKTFNYSDKNIEAVVETVDRENYKLWSNWFSYLKDEIIYANTYYFREFVEGTSLPKFEYEIKIAEGANFSTEEIRFEIDDKGALWKLISNSIYTAEYDFIRELLQNAIDACLMDCYLDTGNVLKNAFPREWPLSRYCVHVMFSEKQNKLIIQDNGVGMDIHTLNKYLFKTADSGYRHMNVERDFLFPAIAKFGIGFVACLTKADKIKIYTQEKQAEEMITVEIEKDNNLAFIEHCERTAFHGTVVELVLKDKCTYMGIEKFLKSSFYAAAVKVEFINLDTLERISNPTHDVQEYNLERVHLCTEYVETYRKKVEERSREAEEALTTIHEADSLREFLQSVNADETIPIEQVKNAHEEFLRRLTRYSLYIKKNTMSKLTGFTPDQIDIQHEEYEKLLSEIILEVNEFKKKNLDADIKVGRELFTDVGDIQWNPLMPDDVCIIYLDKNFMVEDVQYQIDRSRIEKGRGIIFIKTEYRESESGIEYLAVNPFFFHEGAISAYLLKVRGSNIKLTHYDEEDIISLEQIYDLEYQLEVEFQTQEEEEAYHRQIRQLEEEKYSYRVDILFGDQDVKVLRNVDSCMKENLDWDQGTAFPLEMDYQSKHMGEMAPVFGDSLFCQDGIKLDVDLSGLIPFGVNYYKCNLFADARMELNVTRHDINRDSQLIQKWMERCGDKIQKKVIENIKRTLALCNLDDADLDKCVRKRNDGNFEVSAYDRFVKLLKEMM